MKKKIWAHLLRNSSIILLIVIVIVASLNANDPVENFFTVMMSQAPFMLVYCLGMTLAIIRGGLDLSIGSVAAFSSYIGALLIIEGYIVPGIITAIAIGAAIGLFNGVLISKINVHPFIATYGTNWVVRGLVLFILAGKKIFGFPEGFKLISTGSIVRFSNTMKISNPFVISIVIFLIVLFVLRKTVLGRQIYSVGANPDATRITGVDTAIVTTIVYIMSGMLAAIAGILYAAVLDCAEPNIGYEYGLMSIAATLIGGTPLSGGKGGVANTVVGVLIIVFLNNALAVLGISHLWQQAVFGIIIIFAALINRIKERQLMLLEMY
ncbi:MAG: ABC transporter permease [Caldicoprobacterales bacterium]|jgi:ribose transport system permease protein